MRRLIVLAVLLGAPAFASAQPVTTTAGESKMLCRLWDGTDVALVDSSGNQLVAGTLTCNAGTGTFTIAISQTGTNNDVDANVTNATLACTQSGTWNLTNISGTVSLPTGAATETTLGTRAADATITGRLPAGSTPADNESNTVTITRIGSFLWCFDGVTWDRCPGNSADGLLVNLGANNDVTIAGVATEATLATRTADATVTGRFPAGSTPADNESNTVTITRIGGFLFCFDGTTWDRCPGNSADGLLVNLGANNDVTIAANSSVNLNQWGGTATTLGQKAMSASVPTTLASDQALIPARPCLTSQQWRDSVEYTSQQTDATFKAAPGAGLAHQIDLLAISCNAAVTVTIEFDQTTDDQIVKHYCAGQGDGIVLQDVGRGPNGATDGAIFVTTSAAQTVTVTAKGCTN